MRLLLISNSTMAGEPYLDYPKHEIQKFLGARPIRALFIPYAAVTFPYDEYEYKVNSKFNEIGHTIESIHHFKNPVKAIEQAEAIVVGGGNTWQLVRQLRKHNLLNPLKKIVELGIPYIGWSAGANIACPTLATTNDMPITDPLGFETLSLVPFQINPHYTDKHPVGHAGETRQQRIEEFICLNRHLAVVGLREGSMLKIENNKIELLGDSPLKVFRYGIAPVEIKENPELSALLH